jgi:hypothetical protein
LLLALGVVLAGCDDNDGGPDALWRDDGAVGEDGGGADDVAEEAEPDAGPDLGYDPFAVTAVRPGHGSFQGGTTVIVRGRGFPVAGGAVVHFGEHMAQPADTVVLNDNEIATVTPSGPVGLVDVKVEIGEGEDDSRTLPDGFSYDTIAVAPPSGSIAGGTFVTITGSGTEFVDGDTVTFDERDAVDVTVISATVLTCRTPPGAIGPAAVRIDGAEGEIVVRDAYAYFSTADPANGGLGGDPIRGPGTRTDVCPGEEEGGGEAKEDPAAGTVNVTVLNGATLDPEPEVYVLLGLDTGTTYQGLTDERGMIVFSGPDISGRQIVTAAKEGFESTTIVEFDATDVTIYLIPIPDPEPGPLPPGRLGATISGELIFESGGEFARGPWEIIPPPGEGEVKVAYVYATSWDVWNEPPPSYYGAAHWRVTEDDPGVLGYGYSVFARPATVAIVALAGLETLSDGTFTPYAMGVARHVIAGPGERVDGVDVYVVHPLDVSLQIQLVDPPEVVASGAPNIYRIDVFLDLGGDGVFWSPLRSRYVSDVSRPIVFPAWVTPNGELADATYTVVAGAYNRTITTEGTMEDVNPFSVVISTGHRDVWNPLEVGHFLGIPYAVDPAFGGLVVDNHMTFAAEPEDPDFWLILLQTYPDQAPLWRMILPGCVKEFDLPDIAAVAGLPELPSGYSVWIAYGIRAPGFVYDEWSYRFLYQNYWSAYTADAFIFKFRE